MKPNVRNACSGRYKDWLEINLTPHCNARCEWCVERRGWHPASIAAWQDLVAAAIASGATTVILLGGEPTIHPNFHEIVKALAGNVRVWVTTNGSRLTSEWVRENLAGVNGVNVSVHSDDMEENKEITGLLMSPGVLSSAIAELKSLKARVRLNCNCISGYIDNTARAMRYIAWAKQVGASSVRFAELKFDEVRFVSLCKMFPNEPSLNEDPFQFGCSHDTVIDGLPVNFRQMCGLQTVLRPYPVNPEFGTPGGVLYYDGRIYNGWQVQQEERMKREEIEKILQDVKDGKVTPEDAAKRIKPDKPEDTKQPSSGGFCKY